MATIPIKEGQVPMDISLLATGGIAALFALAMLNGASITEDVSPGATWQTQGVPADQRVIQGLLRNNNVVASRDAYEYSGFGSIVSLQPLANDKDEGNAIREGQVLFDKAMELNGGIEAVFELAQANGIAITSDLAIGGQLRPVGLVVSTYVAAALKNRPYWPASGFNALDALPGGIGYMQIGSDFKIR